MNMIEFITKEISPNLSKFTKMWLNLSKFILNFTKMWLNLSKFILNF